MRDKVVDLYLLALKFVPDWFVTSKMIEKVDNSGFCNDDLFFGDIDYDVTLFSNDIGLISINHNNISLDDDNFEDYDPETINHVRVMTWYNRYKSHIACNKR